MDLEVAGRHALLFDDDAAAAFVNSADALVEWHSLQIDRYDVRHLLSAPPPPRRRSRGSEAILNDDPSLQAQLDHERYLDLLLNSDEPEVKEDENPSSTGGYRAVAFSYGDSADQENTAAGMESPGFMPPFPIPGNLVPSLPPTEKVHQIIARTAMFVSKHGGQSEIILRVKQGDNPTFGFLMPDHHLHAYFRYLVEHPELLHSEFDGKSQDKGKKADNERNNSNGAGGALSLLGSVYGSGEEEDASDTPKAEEDVSQDNISTVGPVTSNSSKKMESKGDAAKDETVSKNTILSNKDKVLMVKKSTLITGSKPGSVKGSKKEDKSGSSSAAANNTKNSATGVTSRFEPLMLEPPTELKKLIEKLVEFISRNGKQFEATLIEQDRKHGRFPFLLQSNPYHPYYLKALQTAEESKLNGKSSSAGKDNLVGSGKDRNASALKENESYLPDACDMPMESGRKEKFKMVIGKQKDTLEKESKGSQQESAINVDAAAAAAILQAATRGMKNSYFGTFSNTSPSPHAQVDSNGGGKPGISGSLPAAVEKAEQNGSHGVPAISSDAIARRTDREASTDADSSEAHLTEEQKLKAERLRRAKMFVARLKSGEVPLKTGNSRGPSAEPLESGVSGSADKSNDHNGIVKEGSLAPEDFDRTATGEKPDINYFGDEHRDRNLKRKYRSKSGECDEDDNDNGDKEDHKDSRSRKYRSRSRRYEGDENENAVEKEHKHHRRRHRSHSEENEDKGDSDKEDKADRDYSSRRAHRSKEDDKYEDKHDTHKRSRKKHRSHHSSRKRRSSKHYLDEDDEHEKDERDHKHTRKKHRSHHSSRHSRDRDRRKKGHSSKDDESRHKHESSSDDENLDKREKDLSLEEGEISSIVSEESRGVASGHVSREASVDVLSSHQTVSSQPSEHSAEVPNDLRAKIRAMLMATRS